jgi:hypothetical protein
MGERAMTPQEVWASICTQQQSSRSSALDVLFHEVTIWMGHPPLTWPFEDTWKPSDLGVSHIEELANILIAETTDRVLLIGFLTVTLRGRQTLVSCRTRVYDFAKSLIEPEDLQGLLGGLEP